MVEEELGPVGQVLPPEPDDEQVDEPHGGSGAGEPSRDDQEQRDLQDTKSS